MVRSLAETTGKELSVWETAVGSSRGGVKPVGRKQKNLCLLLAIAWGRGVKLERATADTCIIKIE